MKNHIISSSSLITVSTSLSINLADKLFAKVSALCMQKYSWRVSDNTSSTSYKMKSRLRLEKYIPDISELYNNGTRTMLILCIADLCGFIFYPRCLHLRYLRSIC